ncbi:metallophosphoesterase [Paenibacillus macerans]|uniref:metallophosphoesterase n=1 Tax=Paenibacillus macerans TaxID=44252 RepID=UPI003D3138DE
MNITHNPPRLLAVSDIHGHSGGLELLLAEAGYSPQRDRLVLLGDYINADPYTWGTLDLIQRLTEGGATALLGNLEVSLLRKTNGTAERLVPADRLDWLSALPYYAIVDDWLFVHAGLRPGVPLDRQTPDDLTGIRDEFWSAVPDCGYAVVFGHTPTFKLGAGPGDVWSAAGRLGIDTGAKHGQRLTLLDLSGKLAYSCSTSPANLYGDVRRHTLRLSGRVK